MCAGARERMCVCVGISETRHSAVHRREGPTTSVFIDFPAGGGGSRPFAAPRTRPFRGYIGCLSLVADVPPPLVLLIPAVVPPTVQFESFRTVRMS